MEIEIDDELLELSIDDLYKRKRTAYKYFFLGAGLLGLNNVYLKKYKNNILRYSLVFISVMLGVLANIIGMTGNESSGLVVVVLSTCIGIGIFVSSIDLFLIPKHVKIYNENLKNIIDSGDKEAIKKEVLYSKNEIIQILFYALPFSVDSVFRRNGGLSFMITMLPIWILSIVVEGFLIAEVFEVFLKISFIGSVIQENILSYTLAIMLYALPILMIGVFLTPIILIINCIRSIYKISSSKKLEQIYNEINEREIYIIKTYIDIAEEDKVCPVEKVE